MVIQEEAIGWLKKAESDIKHAQHSIEDKDFDWAEFASHQAAEKALKSLCIRKGVGLIKIHDLTVLARKLNAPIKILEKCGLLNAFYTAARYPDSEKPITPKVKEETAAKDALKAAKEVIKWCKNQIKI